MKNDKAFNIVYIKSDDGDGVGIGRDCDFFTTGCDLGCYLDDAKPDIEVLYMWLWDCYKFNAEIFSDNQILVDGKIFTCENVESPRELVKTFIEILENFGLEYSYVEKEINFG